MTKSYLVIMNVFKVYLQKNKYFSFTNMCIQLSPKKGIDYMY